MSAITETVGDVLLASGLCSGYGDLIAVRDVSVSVGAAEIVGVLGRNGAGKTSLLRAIAGLNRVSEGTVAVAGRNVTKMPVHRRVARGIAFVQDGKRVFRQRTVEHNLVLGAYSRRLRRRETSAEISPGV
jgi:branched-chain amino acid transport system ATP-binding protein